jgi:hypothetical protein
MRFRLLVGLMVTWSSSSGAQAVIQYRPSGDTLRFESTNTYQMFFVRGADTLGEPITTRTLELQHFASVNGALSVWVRLQSLEGNSFSREDTYTVTTSGRVLTEGGRSVDATPHARVDLLPRLPDPAVPFNVGARWVDTVGVAREEAYGATRYSVAREWRVTRMVDTMGTSAALLVAQGTMRLRQGGWQDSIQGIVWWQEATGPVVDSAWFDTRNGALLADVTLMNLAGTGGGGPRTGGGAVMPSGLRSVVRRIRRRDRRRAA